MSATPSQPAAALLAADHTPTRSQIDRLESSMRGMPQVELETWNHFADGMLARVVARPAGTVIVGKVHRKEHFYIVSKGCVEVTTDSGIKRLPAGSILVSQPGTKRVVLALEDSICLTVHRTNKTDLAEIEAELIEPDGLALFNSHNKFIGEGS